MLWLRNIGLSQLFGPMNWFYHDAPKDRSASWRRLLAKYSTYPDLLIFELFARPVRVIWSVVKGESAL